LMGVLLLYPVDLFEFGPEGLILLSTLVLLDKIGVESPVGRQ